MTIATTEAPVRRSRLHVLARAFRRPSAAIEAEADVVKQVQRTDADGEMAEAE